MTKIDIYGVAHAYDLTEPVPSRAIAGSLPLPPVSETARARGSRSPQVPASASEPVLVFIHGWLLSRHYWRPLVDRLRGEYRCLCYDLRGFGDSKLPLQGGGGEYTLAAYARDLQGLLDRLGIQRAWLIGHSLGGSIALWGAECCGTVVEGVICINSGGGIYIQEEFERFRQAGQQIVKRRPFWLPYVPAIDCLFARAMVARPLERRWGRQRVLDFVKANTEAAIGALLDSTTEAEVHLLPQLVARLPQPVYFLAGEQDTIMEPRYVGHLASFHRLFGTGADNLFEIPNCGHMAMLEQPDTTAAIIGQILGNHRGTLEG